ncbi:MAG: baseplate J/gp47 family protein [Candidatus Oceanisphaera merdipullorum]|nr:baseplate J/gp47 family protein [Candidatus Oceanisphaera merdipullorum]
MNPFDFARLPPPQIIEPLDFETIFTSRKTRLIELHPPEKQADIAALLELESEPITKILQENAYRELLLRDRINSAAKAVMLGYSKNEDLDNLLGNFYVPRLVVKPQDLTTIPPTPAVMESDDDFRDRGQTAFEGLSVAGPRAAYEFHARSADGRVADVSAISPTPAAVLLSVLSREGNGTAPPDLLSAVEAAVTQETIRPVGDRVTVQSAIIKPVTISAELYLESGPESELVLAAANQALLSYQASRRRLGGSVYRSAIDAALHVEGVRHVVVLSPAADIELDRTGAPDFAPHTLVVGE